MIKCVRLSGQKLKKTAMFVGMAPIGFAHIFLA